MKELIVNGDDFGLSAGVNRAIITAWREGILTSASLMVGGAAFSEATKLAHEHPGLQVGLHLTLVQGRAAGSHGGFPCIVDRNGNFTNDPVHAGMRYYFLKPLRKQLYREIEAQIETFLQTGLPLSHIDGHLNIHLHPLVFDLLAELMPRYGIGSIRLTRERLGCELAVNRRRLFGKIIDAFIFSRLAARAKPLLDQRSVYYAAEVKGLLSSGNMVEDYLLRVIDRLEEGVTELYFHPALHPCPELKKCMPGYRHEDETAALTSPRVKEKLKNLGVRLRNYRGEEKKC